MWAKQARPPKGLEFLKGLYCLSISSWNILTDICIAFYVCYVWYFLINTCHLLLATCYLLSDSCYWHWYLILIIRSLLLFAIELLPFAPVVRLALVLVGLEWYGGRMQQYQIGWISRLGLWIVKIPHANISGLTKVQMFICM